MDSTYETMSYYYVFFPDSVGLAGFFIHRRYGPYVMCVLHWKHLLQSCFEHETFAACICSETWRHYNKWSQMSQTCLHLFSKPVGVGYRYQPYLRTLWSAGGKSGIKLRCKTWRRNTYYCPTEKASTNVESCLVMSIAHLWILAMHMFHTQWFCSLRRCSLRGP